MQNDEMPWRIVSSPDKFPNEAAIDDFKLIRNAIISGDITPFICETVFTLEAIKRNKRREFFTDYKAKTGSSTSEADGEVKVSFSIGPDKSAHPGNNEYLESHLKDALSIGFNIVKLPRIAGIVNPDIEHHFFNHDDLKGYLDKVHATGRELEARGAGFAQIKAMGEKYGTPWFRGLKLVPNSEDGLIAKAVAEWADGDSVACHIALGGDYFCTRDAAKKAGDDSILGKNNLEWLEEQYGFLAITPEKLSERLQGIQDAQQGVAPNA